MMQLLLSFAFASVALAQTPKTVPPAGVSVPDADRAELKAGLDRLHAAIEKLHSNPLIADVIIYEKAVRYALEYNEFFKADEIAKAKTLLAQGEDRAAQLAQGHAPWTTATG